MAFFEFKNIKVAGVACAVPKNEIKTESYKPIFGDEEVEKFMAMTGVVPICIMKLSRSSKL